MREFQAFGVDAVAQALRDAAAAEGTDPLVAVSEDGANVRRVRPLEPVTDAWTRSVYVVRLRPYTTPSLTFAEGLR